jgi:lipopolysaccharide export system protein LptC
LTGTNFPGTDNRGTPAAGPATPRKGLDFVSRARTVDDFDRARRHSRRVAFLKFGLPVFAALAVVGIVGAFFWSAASLPSINLGATKIEDGKLVMDNPQLNGFDQKKRPYSLAARKAIQDATHPTRITLEEITASLPMDTGVAKVVAGNGFYDADAQTLKLGGSVSLDTEDGMSIRLDDADIDIGAGEMKTVNTVMVDTGRAVVNALGLTVEDKGARIVFESRVRMTIRPEGKPETKGEAKPDRKTGAASANARLFSAKPIAPYFSSFAPEGSDQ